MRYLSPCSFLLVVLLASLFPSTVLAVDVKLSGQINRAILFIDDGKNSETLHVDNTNSSTRFRLTGNQAFDNYKVGVAWETEFVSNASSAASVGQKDDGSSAFRERKLELWISSNWGKLSMGQGDGAANATSEVDLSGTAVIMYSDIALTGGGTFFLDGSGANVVKLSDTRNNFDGLSRNDRLRYDTPSFGGFVASTSFTNGKAREFAGTYTRDFDGLGKVAAAIGYIDGADRVAYSQLGMSASWLHPSGVNLTAVYGNRDPDVGDDAKNYYVKAGYKFGIHAVAVEYGQTEDLAQKGDDSSNIGAAYVANVWSGVELYSTLRQYSLDRTGVSGIDDISVGMAGARVKF